MLKKLAITVGGLLLIIVFIVGTFAWMVTTMIAAGKKMVPPPEPVTTTAAQIQEWEPLIPAIGSLTAVQGVVVAAQLDGNIVKIAFQAGAKVKAGDLLVQQDITTETAQLAAAQATVELSKVNLERSRELLANSTISKQQFDADDAAYKQTSAQVANVQSVIDKKTIRAPFSGRLGLRLVNLGQTLRAGDAIVSLQALDPIYADFFLPQQNLAHIRAGLDVKVTCDALAGKSVDGPITAINPEVDAATRNVKMEATIPNPDETLHPGMFVNVEVVMPTKDRVLIIPSTSILYAPYGDSIFIVEAAKTGSGKVLRQQFIRLGAKRGDFVSVLSGLKEGEIVVTSGTFKLRNGMSVVESNKLASPSEIAPKPEDS